MRGKIVTDVLRDFSGIGTHKNSPGQSEQASVVMCGRIVTDVFRRFPKSRHILKLAGPRGLGLSCDVRQESNWRFKEIFQESAQAKTRQTTGIRLQL